jgi:hypothetical protein
MPGGQLCVFGKGGDSCECRGARFSRTRDRGRLASVTVPIREYYQLVSVPPSSLIFWNHGVRARLPSKSLRNKDLHVKYSEIKT